MKAFVSPKCRREKSEKLKESEKVEETMDFPLRMGIPQATMVAKKEGIRGKKQKEEAENRCDSA